MAIFDKLLNSMKLYDDDDDFEDDDDMEEEEEAPRRGRSARAEAEEAPAARRAAEPAPRAARKEAAPSRKSASVVSMRSSSRGTSDSRESGMDICMVRPTKLDDARLICEDLLNGRAVVINMEGVHVDLSQRIIDFVSGACFSVKGNLQKISKYIFIVTPASIDLSGDFQEGSKSSSEQDMATLSLDY